ncbi:cation:proton antiporter [bacterium]|nr:cation:proton antiporter [bacterium]
MGIAGDIVLIVVAGWFCGLIAQKLKLPVVLGYIVAGILVSPNTFGPKIVNLEQVELLADIGVALLLFTVGLEFPLEKLSPVKNIALIGTPIQIIASVAVGVVIGFFYDWNMLSCIWFGCIISVSSTMVVLKVLGDRGLTGTLSSQVMTAILIMQDLAVIPMLILLPELEHLSSGLGVLAQAIVKSVLLLVFVASFLATAVPKFIARIAELGSRELFMVTVLAFGLGMGLITYKIGLSFAFGAFLGGIVLSRSDFNHHALSEITPLKDLFSLLFFVSVGMLLDLGFVYHNIMLILLTILFIFIGKGLVFGLVTRMFGYVNIMPLAVGLYMFQVGEFAFVLARTGIHCGGISKELYLLSITVAAVTIAITPFFANMADPIYQWWRRRCNSKVKHTITVEKSEMENHIVIIGYGRMGSFIAKAMPADKRVLVIEAHPARVRAAKTDGFEVIGGDASSKILLKAANLEKAAIAVMTIPDPLVSTLTQEMIHSLNPNLRVLARATSIEHMQKMIAKGCSEAMVPEFEASLSILRDMSNILSLKNLSIEQYVSEVRSKQYGPLLKGTASIRRTKIIEPD